MNKFILISDNSPIFHFQICFHEPPDLQYLHTQLQQTMDRKRYSNIQRRLERSSDQYFYGFADAIKIHEIPDVFANFV